MENCDREYGLKVIEVNVAKTKDYVERGEKELIESRKAQWEGQKKYCMLTAFMLMIVVIVIFPIMFGAGPFEQA